MATDQQLVAGLYTAFFNRAPDKEGLDFWTARFADGATVNILAGQFAGHPVFDATYGDMDDETFVDSIYTNILGAPGDAEGVEFWVGQLGAGMPRDQFIAEFVYASLNYDGTDPSALERQAFLTNKADVGIYFAETMGDASNLDPATDPDSKESLESDSAYIASQAAIAAVTHDPATAEAAKDAIDAAAPGGPGEPGNTVELTADPDTVDLTGSINAPDTVVLTAATDSQISDTSGDGTITVDADTGFDTLAGFVTGAAASADRIDLSSLAIAEPLQGVVDVSATVSAATDLTSAAGLFGADEMQQAAAWFTDGTDSWLLVDANQDGDFTAADDVIIAITGVTALTAEDVVF